MTTSLDTWIRRTFGVVVGVAALALVGAGSAFAGERPSASYYTKQQLEAMSQSWAAKAALSSPASPGSKALLQAIAAANAGPVLAGDRPASSYYTKQQLEAMSARWAIEAALSSLTPAQRQSLLQGAAPAPIVRTSSGGFDWGDFGIGAAGMLGLVMVAGGALGVARLGRHVPHLPARHAPA